MTTIVYSVLYICVTHLISTPFYKTGWTHFLTQLTLAFLKFTKTNQEAQTSCMPEQVQMQLATVMNWCHFSNTLQLKLARIFTFHAFLHKPGAVDQSDYKLYVHEMERSRTFNSVSHNSSSDVGKTVTTGTAILHVQLHADSIACIITINIMWMMISTGHFIWIRDAWPGPSWSSLTEWNNNS